MSLSNNDTILKLIRCPKCSNFIHPPSVICENGHIVCKKCKEERCVMCRTENYPNRNNYLFDYLLKEISYPCMNEEHGCTEVLRFNDLHIHKQICEYELYPCMFSSEGCTKFITLKHKSEHERNCEFGVSCKILVRVKDLIKVQCNWRGLRNNLHEHVCQKHEFVWLTRNLETNVVFPWLLPLNMDFERVELIKLEDVNEIFYFYTKCEEDAKQYLAIQYIGTIDKASEYLYNIEFSDGDKKVVFEGTVLPMNLDSEQVYLSSNCFETNFQSLKKLFLAERCIDCNIKIFKKNSQSSTLEGIKRNFSFYGAIIPG